jgi:hypothetical protein
MATNLKQHPATPDRVLTLDQFCELNSIGKNTAKRLIAAGDGPPHHATFPTAHGNP